jgi:glycosyltransferase involved in cell wall biosynthesis
LKVLHISTFDCSGGAGRSAYRLHKGLLGIGIDSWMLVRNKSSDDPQVLAPKQLFAKAASRLRANLNNIPLYTYQDLGHNDFSVQWFPERIFQMTESIGPDIILIHWIGTGYLRIETLARFKKPIVWVLQDMWAFTGGCYYSQGCNEYANTCGKCPLLKSRSKHDLSHSVWMRKYKAWNNINLTVVAPTSWLSACATSSSLFAKRRIVRIPHGLDVRTFKPLDKSVARNALNLPKDKFLILFGSIEPFKDRRKGLHFLQSAIERLKYSKLGNQVELIVFGTSQPENPPKFAMKVNYVGKFQDDLSLALMYSAADVMVVPSEQEAFGQTASESLSCATPVVAFDGTGLSDIVAHKKTGYLARHGEADDLAHGIGWILEDRDRYDSLASSARRRAESEFSVELQAEQYSLLLNEISNMS